jgi:aryl-alcohol dehydrogenase-like predicted oxidoreductase
MSNLERRPLGRTGLEVTRIGFGALEIGRDWDVGDEAARRRPEAEEAGRMLNGVLDLGVNLIDSARAYHRSEERIGASIAARRAEYVLATKCGEHSEEPRTYYDFSYRAIANSIDTSLRLLQTDVIDLLQIHFGPEPEKVLEESETVRAMKDAREAGKVRFLGASPGNSLLDRCIESGDFDVLQVGYSLLDRGAHDLITKAGDRGIGILIRSGLGGGWLTPRALTVPAEKRPEKVRALLDLVGGDGEKLHALALAFQRSHPAISSILVGSKNLENFRRNLARYSEPVEPELLEQALAQSGP